MKSAPIQIMVAIVVGSLLVCGAHSRGEIHIHHEYRVKAAFIYNFAKFVEWPADAFADTDSPLVFTILGDNPFGDVFLDTLANKTVRNRPFEIRESSQLEDLAPCHILFISKSEESQLTKIIEKTSGWPVMTVSELKQFTQQNGCIQFFLADKKIRFAINPQVAEQKGLRISSQLLRLAQNPKEAP